MSTTDKTYRERLAAAPYFGEADNIASEADAEIAALKAERNALLKPIAGIISRRLVHLTPATAEQPAHDLYKTGDADAPEQILDRNGEVVLGQCRKCGRAEVELSEPCTAPATAEQPAERATPLATEADFTLEEEAVGFLRDMIAAGDEPVPLRFMIGLGHSGFGVYVCESECPEEGTCFVQSLVPPEKTVLVAATAPAPVAPIEGVAMIWKDRSGLHFSASGKTTDKEVELVNKVCIALGMPAGYFDALVGVWRGDDKNCHEIPLLRAIVTAYCMGVQA